MTRGLTKDRTELPSPLLPNQGIMLLSASLNTESEKILARKLFEQEKAKVAEELRIARNRHRAKLGFSAIDALDLHNQIMDRGITG